MADRQELRKKLKRGDVLKVASATGLTRQYVSKWFKGYHSNPAVCEAVHRIAAKREEELNQNLKEL